MEVSMNTNLPKIGGKINHANDRSWSHGIWIYNYRCNQCLSPLRLWVRNSLRRHVLDTTLCDNVCQWLATGQWFSPVTSVSSTNKTDRHDITEILLKVAKTTMNLSRSLIWPCFFHSPCLCYLHYFLYIRLVSCDTNYYSWIFSIVPDFVIS